MAQFGFGLNINETAQETGYDQYQTSLFESLGAVAADNWNFNPVISLLTLKDIQTAKQESRIANIVPRDKKLLNEWLKAILRLSLLVEKVLCGIPGKRALRSLVSLELGILFLCSNATKIQFRY